MQGDTAVNLLKPMTHLTEESSRLSPQTLPQKTAHVGGKDLPPRLFSQSFVTVGETAGPGKMAQALQSQREQAQTLS